MKAPSHFSGDSQHLGGPFAAVFVALGGAALVVAGMLVVSAREPIVAHILPAFGTLQSLIIG